MVNKKNILGVILAGGQSRRMGNKNKLLATINNKSLLEITSNLVKNQLNRVIINFFKKLVFTFHSSRQTSS